jgi:hypothetical protein
MRADADSFRHVEKMMLADCNVEAHNPMHVPPGQFKMIERRNPYGQVSERVFIGQDCFVKQMGRPGRRVISFNTTNGPVDAGGRFLR